MASSDTLMRAARAAYDRGWSDRTCMARGWAYELMTDDKLAAVVAPFASPAGERDATGRTAQDYAIEHAGYLARSAETLLDFLSGLDEDEPFADHDGWADFMRDLRGAIHEFRKRAARAQPAPEPAGQSTEPVGVSARGVRSVRMPAPRGGRMSVLRERVREVVEQHGSLRAAARVLECDEAYLCRLRSGEKDNPNDKLLRKLGLRRVVTYERAQAGKG